MKEKHHPTPAKLHAGHPSHPSHSEHSHAAHEHHMESRYRDEGEHLEHMRGDGSVPIMGPAARAIHGPHTGEESMTTPVSGAGPRMKGGKPGEHEEDK